MKRIDKVIPCVCGSMPVIYVQNCIGGKQEYGAKCPVCGRGSETGVKKTNFSAYSALKEWNSTQSRVKRFFENELQPADVHSTGKE